MEKSKYLIAVIGGSKCDQATSELAKEVGKIIATEGAVLVCGGMGGVMEAACKGAKETGGLTIGIIPGGNKQEANPFVDIVIPTEMGYARNNLVAGAADLVIALQGEYGTLSEIGVALNLGKEIYGINTWDIPGIKKIESLEKLREIIKKSIYSA